MAQVFHIFPRPGKKKHCLLAGSFCNLTGRQYLFQLPVSFLWLVKAQGFSCCKASGNKQICHIMTQTCALLKSNLGQFCKKACFAARAQCVPCAKMATVPTHCLQKVRSRSDRCPCNKFHFREKIYRENTSWHEAPTGRPHKSHGTGFPHVSRAWKEKTLLACWKLL